MQSSSSANYKKWQHRTTNAHCIIWILTVCLINSIHNSQLTVTTIMDILLKFSLIILLFVFCFIGTGFGDNLSATDVNANTNGGANKHIGAFKQINGESIHMKWSRSPRRKRRCHRLRRRLRRRCRRIARANNS